MTTELYQPFQPLAADGPALARVLAAAGIEKTDVVRVMGPSGLLAALWLAEHGYQRAFFARSLSSGQPADAVLIPHACSPEAVAEMIDAAEAVCDGGVVIVQARSGRSGEELEAISAFLRRLGFDAQRRVNDKGRQICIARRVDYPTARRAA
jgi:hypothetical protein